MNNMITIMAGALGVVLIAFVLIVVSPHIQIEESYKYRDKKVLSQSAQSGRKLYVSLGCHACHSQQVRDNIWSNDTKRGWGRPSISQDYQGQQPHVLGTMRTGPDLTNIGERQPSEVWHFIHLFQPRSVVPQSNMPSYPFLFDVIGKNMPVPMGQINVAVPEKFIPVDKKVVTKDQAKDIVNYLKSLTQPAL